MNTSTVVTTDELDDLIRRIRRVVEPRRIILFGSAARGEMRPDSDLDVLVTVADDVHPRRAAQAVYPELVGFGRAVDVIVSTEADVAAYGDDVGYIYQSALRDGREVYAAP